MLELAVPFHRDVSDRVTNVLKGTGTYDMNVLNHLKGTEIDVTNVIKETRRESVRTERTCMPCPK